MDPENFNQNTINSPAIYPLPSLSLYLALGRLAPRRSDKRRHTLVLRVESVRVLSTAVAGEPCWEVLPSLLPAQWEVEVLLSLHPVPATLILFPSLALVQALVARHDLLRCLSASC